MIAVTDNRILPSAMSVAVHHPWLVEFIDDWRKAEVDKLAYIKDDFAKQQGRVQALDEVIKLFRNAEVDLRRSQG